VSNLTTGSVAAMHFEFGSRVSRLTVTVVMATHNGARFIRQQVDSILSQLETGDELLIVDDASTDSTIDELMSYTGGVVTVLRNEKNMGVVRSFERGLSEAGGDIIFLADQDDVWLPGKRSVMAGVFAQDPSVRVVLSDAELIDETGKTMGCSFMEQRGGFAGGFWPTFAKNRFLGCTMAFRRDVLQVALPIPASAPMHDMWLGIVGGWTGRVVYLPQPLMQYRRHSHNVTTLKRRPLAKGLIFRIKLLRASVPRWLTFLLRGSPTVNET
jgi:glycosyltransferase involved in cell wall biosynthesis